MSKDMCSGNRPNFNSGSGLTPNGRGPAGERPGSARERNAVGSPRASRPSLRRFFASGTPASAEATPGGSGGPPADVAELDRDPRGARAAPPTSWPSSSLRSRPPPASTRRPPPGPGTAAGPDVELDAQPARRGPPQAASGNGSTSWPTSPARTRSRRRQAARSPSGTEDLQMPAKPRWLLAIPDAISQLATSSTSSASPRSAPPRS